jgi:hypothetical protein
VSGVVACCPLAVRQARRQALPVAHLRGHELLHPRMVPGVVKTLAKLCRTVTCLGFIAATACFICCTASGHAMCLNAATGAESAAHATALKGIVQCASVPGRPLVVVAGDRMAVVDAETGRVAARLSGHSVRAASRPSCCVTSLDHP